MSDSKRWHVTHLGSERSPMVWKLEGNQVIVFGLSLGGALFLFRLLVDGFEWSSFNAAILSGLLPVIVLTVLITLVKGKPKRHLRRWLEWQVIKGRFEDLLVERPNHLEILRERIQGHRKSGKQDNNSTK